MKRALGKDSLAGLHIALQGAGSVASGLARRAAAEGARLSIADIDQAEAQALAAETGGDGRRRRRDHDPRGRRAQPQRARRDPRPRSRSRRSTCRSSPAAPTTSSPRREDGDRIHARGHPLRARLCDQRRRHHQRLDRISRGRRPGRWSAQRIEPIPGKLEAIWEESAATGRNAAEVADAMARRLIGRA